MENEKHTKEEIRQHREERVKERMAENRRVTSLSEAQHDALEYLCSVRHEMHSGQKAFFLSDDPRHERFELLIGQGGKGAINTVLLNAGLPTVSLDTEIFKAETDKCFKREDYGSDSDYEMAKARAFDRSVELADKLNDAIEEYLGEIDRRHGTNYKPYGGYRFHKPSKAQTVRQKIVKAEVKNGVKPRVFVDMDGTLAKFNNQISSPEELYEEGYFLNLEPQQRVVDAVKDLVSRGNVEVFIMSAYLADSQYALSEKNEWADRYLPEIDMSHRIFPPCGESKLQYIPNGVRVTDVLLDDYTVNLNDWEPPAIGVKLLNDINSTKGTWQGQKISFNRHPREITKMLEDITLGKAAAHDRSREVGQAENVKKIVKDISALTGDTVRITTKAKVYELPSDILLTALNGVRDMDDAIRFKSGRDSIGRQYSHSIPLSDIDTITTENGKTLYENKGSVLKDEEQLLNQIFGNKENRDR